MVEQRQPDLGYGHPGEVSYNFSSQLWTFPRTVDKSGISKSVPPALKSTSSIVRSSKPGAYHEKQSVPSKQWLANAVPESVAASTILTSLNRINKLQDQIDDRGSATLLAYGKASDINQKGSRQRNIPIFAMCDGEAGQLLKISRPHNLVQKSRNGLRLQTMSPVPAEAAYHFIPGSSIQQICFASDTEGSTSWLAIRNAESTMIFRPIYCQLPVPSEVPESMKKQCPPSRLFPNPITILRAERTGGKCHTDISFNPWYVRQFVVIDTSGQWSIWDIEGQKRKRSTFVLVPGKSGSISADPTSEASPMLSDNEPWGRALWAGSVSTLVVCQRQQLALFDIKSTPKRVSLPDIFRVDSERWILDIKRNPARLDQLFILTTSRIIVMEIAVNGHESETNSFVASVLLSCPHFRNSNSESLKLEVSEESDACLALLYSTQNSVINTYRLLLGPEGGANLVCSPDAVTLYRTQDSAVSVNTLVTVPGQLLSDPIFYTRRTIPEGIEHNLHLYQIFFLTDGFDLHRALLATTNQPSRILREEIAALQIISTLSDSFAHVSKLKKIKSSTHVIDDDFIVPDELDDDVPAFDEEFAANHDHFRSRRHDHRLLTVNACRLHASAFPDPSNEIVSHRSVRRYIEDIQDQINARTSEGQRAFVSCSELIRPQSFSDDVDEASVLLQDMILSFKPLEENSPMTFSFSSVESFDWPGLDSKEGLLQTTLTVSNIYDTLVDAWVTCLPRRTPNALRLARERVVRSIAMEMFLSSLTVSIRKEDPDQRQIQEDEELVLPVRIRPASPLVSRDSNKMQYDQDRGTSSHGRISASQLRGLSPDPHSFGDNLSTGVKGEDGAITRLRGYLTSSKALAPLGPIKSTILAHWPADLGADPFKYSWEAARRDLTAGQDLDSDSEEAIKRQREDERRRRRTERLLRKQKADTNEASSPRAIHAVATGSQPLLADPNFSSQPTEPAIAMSQPGRGTHGSRLGQHIKKKKVRAFR